MLRLAYVLRITDDTADGRSEDTDFWQFVSERTFERPRLRIVVGIGGVVEDETGGKLIDNLRRSTRLELDIVE